MRQPALWWACLCAVLLAPVVAQANSIDCAKAKTKVETLLCTDPALKKQDLAVAQAFSEALDIAPDTAAVRAGQRQWLAARNACPDAACLTARHEERQKELAGLVANIQEGFKTERARLRTLFNWPKECEDSFQELVSPERNGWRTSGVTSYPLEDGRTLYAVQCDQAAYQDSYVAVLQERPDGPGNVLRFPLFDADGKTVHRSEDTHLAGMLTFNAQARTLTVFTTARGVGDCGSYVIYAFPQTNAPRVSVVEARAKDCSNSATAKYVAPEHWPLVKRP